MTHNDVLRSIRHLLDVYDRELVAILRLGGCEDVGLTEVIAFLKREDEEGYLACPDVIMAHFLNGLVIYKRGQDDTRPPPVLEAPVTNNTILKKLRVAFELKDGDILTLIERVGLRVSKAELGAFFRRPDHRNYRECGDQFLRHLLKGLHAASSSSADRR